MENKKKKEREMQDSYEASMHSENEGMVLSERSPLEDYEVREVDGLEAYNDELDQAEQEIDSGKGIPHESVVQAIKTWKSESRSE